MTAASLPCPGRPLRLLALLLVDGAGSSRRRRHRRAVGRRAARASRERAPGRRLAPPPRAGRGGDRLAGGRLRVAARQPRRRRCAAVRAADLRGPRRARPRRARRGEPASGRRRSRCGAARRCRTSATSRSRPSRPSASRSCVWRALGARIDADLALGRHADLVGELQALVAEHPLRESLRAQLMLALYRCGRQADALAAYGDARQMLADELGPRPVAGAADAGARHPPAPGRRRRTRGAAGAAGGRLRRRRRARDRARERRSIPRCCAR